MKVEPKEFAQDWIEAWNSRDIDRIIDHYADDVEINSPMIMVALGIDSGTLVGKKRVREYFSRALEKVPDLHFHLRDITMGNDSIAIYYESVRGKMAIEVMYLNGEGLIERMIAHYSQP